MNKKRKIKKQFWFNSDEDKKLKKLSKETKKCEADIIRELVMDCELKEKPDQEFYNFIRVLYGIGNNINQLSKRANTNGFIDELEYKKEKQKLDKFIDDILKKYL
ncbi:MAG: plasmid mobilization relaxosome protein MobC [Bacilli bacterium]|nr:plasmid mobilization relaxosome protein MobC [Bacilli bacterium]